MPTFAHPTLLWAALAIIIPWLIHWIGRQNAPKIPFAAFDFLLEINRRFAHRERWRQWLLLLVRTLAIAALVGAVARPYLPQDNGPEALATATPPAVLVLDHTASMRFRVTPERTLLDQAREDIDAWFATHAQTSCALITVGQNVEQPLGAGLHGAPEIRRALSKLGPEWPAGPHADMTTALTLASQEAQRLGVETIWVFSDLAWPEPMLQAAALGPTPPRLRIVDTGATWRPLPGAALPNISLTDVTVLPDPDMPQGRILDVHLHNHGNRSSAVELHVYLNDRALQHSELEVEPRSDHRQQLHINLPEAGDYRLRVESRAIGGLPGYTDDDHWHGTLLQTPTSRVLVINGAPHENRYTDETFFLEKALTRVPAGTNPIDFRVVDLNRFESERPRLNALDVVILAHVNDLSAHASGALQTFVAQGGGLLITLGDIPPPELFNPAFGELLAAPIKTLHQPETGPQGIVGIDWQHPLLAGLDRHFEASLQSSRTSRYALVEPFANTQTLLSFNDGNAMLIERPSGQGKVMLWTTSIDADFSDIPLRSGFPALAQRLVQHLAGHLPSPQHRQRYRKLQALPLRLPSHSQAPRLEWRAADQAVAAKLRQDTTHWRAEPPADLPVGVHEAWLQSSASAAWERWPAADLTIHPNLQEADFAPIDTNRLAQAWAQSSAQAGDVVMTDQKQEKPWFDGHGYAAFLLAGLCGLFALESLLGALG